MATLIKHEPLYVLHGLQQWQLKELAASMRAKGYMVQVDTRAHEYCPYSMCRLARRCLGGCQTCSFC